MSDRHDAGRRAAPDDTLGAIPGGHRGEPRVLLAAPALDRVLGRRGFLRGGLLAGAAVQAVACGGGKKKDELPEGYSRMCVAQYYPTHAGLIRSLALSADGSRLATAGDDKLVKVWNAATGALIQTYRGHAAAVNAVALSPDGQRCASVGDSFQVWNANTGALLVDYGARTGYALAWWPDGSRVVIGGDYGTIWAFDAQDPHGQVLGFQGGFDRVTALSFSRDGTKLVAACAFACVWDTATRALLQTYSQAPSTDLPTRAVAFSPDGARVASGGTNATLHVWDVATGARLAGFDGHTGPVTSVAFDAAGTRLVSCGADATWVWDATATGSVSTPLTGLGPAAQVAFSPDGARLMLARLHQFWRQTGGVFHPVQECHVVLELAASGWGVVAQLADTTGRPVEQVDSSVSCGAGKTLPGAACYCDVVCACDAVCTCDSQGGCPNIICLIVF